MLESLDGSQFVPGLFSVPSWQDGSVESMRPWEQIIARIVDEYGLEIGLRRQDCPSSL